MSTYAQPADLKAYSDLSAIQTMSDPALSDLLEKAEHDIDQTLIPPVQFLTVADRKIDPTDLLASQALALQNGTCAQAEYRIVMGEEFFIRGQFIDVTGPGGFTQKGRQPIIGPKVKREMAGSGLMPFGAQASPNRKSIR